MAQGGRKTQIQALHEISVQITPAMAATIGGVIGVLPAGAIMGQIHLCMSQVFNSTTNTFGVGTLPPPGGANMQGGIPGTPAQRSDNMMPFPQCGPFGVDTPIYWTAAFTGPAPTQGLLTLWLDYLPGPG